MITSEKLVLFGFKSVMKGILFFIFSLFISVASAQDKDKDLIKSNDYVYEGNAVVDNNFIEAEKEYRKAISKKPSNVKKGNRRGLGDLLPGRLAAVNKKTKSCNNWCRNHHNIVFLFLI